MAWEFTFWANGAVASLIEGENPSVLLPKERYAHWHFPCRYPDTYSQAPTPLHSLFSPHAGRSAPACPALQCVLPLFGLLLPLAPQPQHPSTAAAITLCAAHYAPNTRIWCGYACGGCCGEGRRECTGAGYSSIPRASTTTIPGSTSAWRCCGGLRATPTTTTNARVIWL